MTACDCDPGNATNGWMETRGPNCAQRDREAWAEFYDRARTITVWVADLIVKE